MLNRNAERVKNLTGGEIWMFIIARVLTAYGAGALGARYYAQIVNPIAVPALVVGMLLFVVAAKGLRRRRPGDEVGH